MDNIADKLSELLGSPDGMDRIKDAARQILGNDSLPPEMQKSGSPQNNISGQNFSPADGLMQNPPDMGNIMRIMSLLKDRKQDKRTELLLALKPHLSEERAKRVDKAVSLLKIASLLPLLKQEGLFDTLGL